MSRSINGTPGAGAGIRGKWAGRVASEGYARPLLSIQYLRAFAAIGVVAFHTGRATNLGQAGVDVFFVISGFIMWMVTANSVSPVQFLRDRVARVVPIYWIATGIMATHQSATSIDVVRSLLFWPYYDAGGHKWPVLLQGWTLNFEMFFYLLFAAILLVPRRFQLFLLTGTLCGLGAIGLALRPHDAAFQTYTSPLFMEFLAGAWLSELARRGLFPGTKVALAMLILGLGGFAISLRGEAPEIWRFLVWGIPSLLVVWGAISIEAGLGLPLIGSLKLLGDASYSIYLFHPFVLRTVLAPLKLFPALVPLAAVTVVCCALGVAAFDIIERPLAALLKRPAGPAAALRVQRVAGALR